MSMNLHLSASRIVTVNRTGKEDTQTIDFNLWQTPTVVTRAAVKPGVNTKQEYINWASKFSKDEQEPVYAEDDIFGERDPISFTTFNNYNSHIAELEAWIKTAKEEGYDIKFYTL